MYSQKVFQYSHKAIRPVFRVHLTSDNRYTPTEGKFKNHSPTVDTTYSVPQVAYHKIMVAHHAIEPSHKQLILPNNLLKGHPKIQAIKAHLDQQSYASPAVSHTSNSKAPQTQPAYSVPHQQQPPTTFELPTHFHSPIPPPQMNPTAFQLRQNYAPQWNSPDYSFLQNHPAFKWQHFQNDYVTSNVSVMCID